MTRICIFAAAGLLLGASAFAQTPPPPQAPNSTTLCPITHACRPNGKHLQHAVAAPLPTGPIQCPPGTYHLPNTNRCRVK
jgi:hypothetical protein